MIDIDLEIADLLLRWQRNAEDAVRLVRMQETEIARITQRANELADDVQALRNQLAIANHALTLAQRTQNGARA